MNEKHPSTSAGDCNSIQDLIPAYAFGLTDADENTLVEATLDGCSDASVELAEYRQLQDEMRASVRQIDPPLMLLTRLAAATATPSAAPVSIAPKPQRRRLPLPWIAAAAALVALVLTNAFWLTRDNALNQERADYLATDNDNPANSSFVLSNTSDLRWVRLQPTEQDGKAAAFLCWNAESQTALLYAWGFAPTPGQTYQLWLTRDNELTNVGTLRFDEKGRTVMLIHSEQPIDQYTWARITAAPENASPQPDGNIVVNGQL